MFECFHCLARAVIWDCDSEDLGYLESGIEYFIPIPEDEETT